MKSLKKSIRLFSLVALCLWLLPLGAFIRPSQEKTACDGKRAFHMCSMMTGRVQTENGAAKISFTDAGSAEKTAKSSASGGDDFVPAGTTQDHEMRRRFEKTISGGFCLHFFQEIFDPPPEARLFF